MAWLPLSAKLALFVGASLVTLAAAHLADTFWGWRTEFLQGWLMSSLYSAMSPWPQRAPRETEDA